MPSFLEKLKKGMNVKELPMEEELKKPSEPKRPKPKPKPGPEQKEETKPIEKPEPKEDLKPKIKMATKQKGQPEKMEIQMQKKSIEIEEVEEPKETAEKKEPPKKPWFEPEGELVTDIYQTQEELVIQSAIAGVKPEDLDIVVENDLITIRGNRRKPEENGKISYFTKECYWGSFSKKIIAPVDIDSSRTKAIIKEGLLTIRIPKIEREKVRKISVNKD